MVRVQRRCTGGYDSAMSEALPTLILLPGLHGTHHLFRPLLGVIPCHIRTRLIEHPTDQCCSYRELFRRLEGELQNESSLILLGESFSGPLALQYAARHPGKVEAVILCASFAGPPVPALLCYLATPLIWLRCPIPGIAIRTFLCGFRAPASLVREARKAIGCTRPRVLAHRVRLTAHIQVSDALQKCRAPILYLAATRDRLVGRRALRRVRRIRPAISVESFDAPHLLLQSKPRQTWEAIMRFPPVAKRYSLQGAAKG
jgi:pimeloyl-[acyl-carrier protein] methyl ester esterase